MFQMSRNGHLKWNGNAREYAHEISMAGRILDLLSENASAGMTTSETYTAL